MFACFYGIREDSWPFRYFLDTSLSTEKESYEFIIYNTTPDGHIARDYGVMYHPSNKRCSPHSNLSAN